MELRYVYSFIIEFFLILFYLILLIFLFDLYMWVYLIGVIEGFQFYIVLFVIVFIKDCVIMGFYSGNMGIFSGYYFGENESVFRIKFEYFKSR